MLPSRDKGESDRGRKRVKWLLDRRWQPCLELFFNQNLRPAFLSRGCSSNTRIPASAGLTSRSQSLSLAERLTPAPPSLVPPF